MHFGRLLLLLFIAVPLVELYLLLAVGDRIGAIPTVVLVVFTAVLGALLVRQQGFAVLARARAQADRGEAPALELIEGAMILVAGLALLLPGFATDLFGFALLLPRLRERIALRLVAHLRPVTTAAADSDRPGSRVIEGEFRRDDD